MKTIEQKIEQLLDELTVEEKVSLCHANSKFTVSSIDRLGIDELTMSDGPHGVRQEIERDSWNSAGWTNDFCTYLPTNTALAATWNEELATKFGETLGEEARFRGKDVILGPGINIIRHPLCGRNFEYMSEDPCLIEKITPPLINGIQSCDTAACVKHFALNNQELDRNKVNVEVSKKALFDIYLKGFESAVKNGNAYTFMGAYNRYLNQHCCHNDYLVNTILKDKWGFDGVYLSDWAGVHDTKEAAFGGLDIEMGTNKPYNEYYLADDFLKLANESDQAMDALNDKARRILRLMFRINKFSKERKKGSFNTKEHQAATYEIATQAMVLLKNENNLLPIKKAQKILVIGENATKKHAAGGNSSGVKALYEITLLEGIKNRFCDSEIEYIKTSGRSYKPIPVDRLEIIDTHAGCRAFKCEAFENSNFSGNSEIKFTATPEATKDFASHKYTALFSVEKGKAYHFSFTGNAGTTLYFDDRIIKNIENDEECYEFSYTAENEQTIIRIESVCNVAPQLLLDLTADAVDIEIMLEKAKNADYVIYCGGLNHSYDTESFDRKDMRLPAIQDIEIPKLLKVNKNTVIAVTAGSPVEMPWINEAPCVLWTWYAGMEGGNAFADIISGKVNPSGKLPFTLPYKYEDHPAVRYGEYQAENCKYNEDIYVGYRGFQKDNIEPMFSFGFGLSYSEFTYSNMLLEQNGDNITVSCTVKNNSDTAGGETVQIYAEPTSANAYKGIMLLKGFKKVFLNGGEEKEVSITLNIEDFKEYNEKSDRFELLCKDYIIHIASSSTDTRLKKPINF